MADNDVFAKRHANEERRQITSTKHRISGLGQIRIYIHEAFAALEPVAQIVDGERPVPFELLDPPRDMRPDRRTTMHFRS